MNKKTIVRIILVAVVLLGCVAAALWFIPKSTKISLSLDAVKLDESGKEIGTAKIEIQGSHLNYLFREDSYDLVIAPFDNLTSIKIPRDNRRSPGTVPSSFFDDYFMLSATAWTEHSSDEDPKDIMSNLVFCRVFFTKDFEHFAFYASSNDEDAYYVASASGDYTTKEIVKAFNGLIPGL